MANRTFPMLFVGHGSPMNVISANAYTRALRAYNTEIPRPDAILVISAHWLTNGTYVNGAAQPAQIYDFYGFPEELYKVSYKAPGSLETAKLVADIVDESAAIKIDYTRGIDHAGWAVLMHLYPDQNIPVIELSLDIYKPPRYHFELARKLRRIREHNVLVIGSGNIVHNLREIDFDENAEPYEWAVEFDARVKKALESSDFETLIEYERLGSVARRSVPTNDHFLPMLWTLGMMEEKNEHVSFFHESIQNGSVSMRCFRIG